MWVVIYDEYENTVHGVLHQDRDALRIMSLTIQCGLENTYYLDDIYEANRKLLTLTHKCYNNTVARYRQLCEAF